jgi:hypothetical protein
MSYTVEIISELASADNTAVLQYLDRIDEEDAYGEPTPAVLEFYKKVAARFPCITENPEGPWADGPLINNFRHPVTTLGISFSRVAEVLPWLIAAANAAGFTLYDPQDDVIHRPGGSSRVLREQEPAVERKPWWRFW